MRDALFSSSRTSIDVHMQTKIDAFCSKWRYMVISRSGFRYLFGRHMCRKHCWSEPRVFSHSFCPQNIIFVEPEIIAISSELQFSEIKQKMGDVLATYDCGMIDICGWACYTDMFILDRCVPDLALCAGSDKSLDVFDLNVGRSVLSLPSVHSRNVHTICQNEVSLHQCAHNLPEWGKSPSMCTQSARTR